MPQKNIKVNLKKKMFTRIFNKLGKNWGNFVTDLKNSAEPDDPD